MAGMRPSKVLRDLFRKTLRLFDGLRPALYRHNGGLSKCIQGAREDRCVPRVSRRALIGKKGSLGSVYHCQISPITSDPWSIVTTQSRIRQRLPIVLPFSAIGESHLGNVESIFLLAFTPIGRFTVSSTMGLSIKVDDFTVAGGSRFHLV